MYHPTLIVDAISEPIEYPEYGAWGVEVIMIEEGDMFETELIFDDEEDAWKIVKYFKTNINPIMWEDPEEDDDIPYRESKGHRRGN